MVYKLLIPVKFVNNMVVYDIFYSDIILDGAIVLMEVKVD